jgi:D-amino-acid dehydrogenase
MQMTEQRGGESQHVVVIGAGIVGACCTLELLRAGHRVTLIEPGEPGGDQSASYGNGAWLSPASVVPMSMPGLWKKVPGYLLDRDGPLTIRWRALGSLAPWLWRFLLAGSTVPRVEATARALAALLHDAPERHRALAAEAGVADLVVQSGLLYAYPDRAAFEAEALAWRLRRDNGVRWEEWDDATLHARVPQLGERYRFGAWVGQGAHCHDPGAYVGALVRHALAQGAQRVRARAMGFEFEGDRLCAVRTESARIECTQAVIAAGVHSRALALEAGDRVSLESERGYHVELPDARLPLPMPVMPSDGKMSNAWLGQGLRIAGQVELASVDAEPDWRRAEVLLGHARASYPALAELPADTPQRRWMGHRPSTPDGRPVIGRSRRSSQVLHAFGHGHVGLASGPVTGRLIAELASGMEPSIDLAPYSPQRFG